MRIEGQVVEIGDLAGYDPSRPGIRLQRGDETIEILGLSRADLSALPPGLIYRNAVLTLAADVRPLSGRSLQPGDFAVTDYCGPERARVQIIERDDSGRRRSQSGVTYRVAPALPGGTSESWYDADWFEPELAEGAKAAMTMFGDTR